MSKLNEVAEVVEDLLREDEGASSALITMQSGYPRAFVMMALSFLRSGGLAHRSEDGYWYAA